ncbi:CaiB/BaiF CoA transferase family protein [Glaciibacter superstes]|uniref:CaiB/BaiF CoA transferase family protein n=1 Tax=Glaciibacter superstes TaxID=501023 RepID=UPI0003B327B5|nr:CoA transferase [Glaciibacter superstes]
MQPPRPLEGLLVVDLTTALSGPYATLQLAGLGARVIKIEDAARGDSSRNNSPFVNADGGVSVKRQEPEDWSVSMLVRGRDKESVTLNLKHPDDYRAFMTIVERADILVENFSPGVTDRLRIDYLTVKASNPRIVYCSISGFGQDTTYGSAKALDAIIQALSGTMFTSGDENEPPIRLGIQLGDMIAPLFAVTGVLAAVHQRHRTGLGQHVDVSMLGALTSMIASEPFDVMEEIGCSGRTGQFVPRLAPFGVFQSSDNWVAICAHTDHLAAALFTAIGSPEWMKGTPFQNREERVADSDTLHRLIEEWTKVRSSTEILNALSDHNVPAAIVRTPTEALRDPIVRDRSDVVPLAHPQLGEMSNLSAPGIPITFDGEAPLFRSAARPLGADTGKVLAEFAVARRMNP